MCITALQRRNIIIGDDWFWKKFDYRKWVDDKEKI